MERKLFSIIGYIRKPWTPYGNYQVMVIIRLFWMKWEYWSTSYTPDYFQRELWKENQRLKLEIESMKNEQQSLYEKVLGK